MRIADYETLIMGDSQMQRLIAEDFDNKTYNFSSSGEHFYFTFNKLLKLTQNDNCGLKRVFLGVSAHNFAPIYSKLFQINSPEGEKSLKSYLYFINIFDSEFLKPEVFYKREMLKAIFSGPDWGGEIRSDSSNPSKSIIDISYNMHYLSDANDNETFKNQIFYLKKIADLCDANNIQLYIISTPYHPLYKQKVNKKYFNMLSDAIDRLVDVKYINFLDYKIETTLFADGNHLNVRGSKLITTEIKSYLKNEQR